MFQTAHPVTAPRPQQPSPISCPECGTPVAGIAATEPGRHEFAACGHEASRTKLESLTIR